MADIVLRHGYLITMDPVRTIIPDATVVIEGNRIVDLGDADETRMKQYSGSQILDAKNMAIFPGLICTHTHLYQVLLRSLGDDYGLEDWLNKMMFPLTKDLKPTEAYFAAQLGCAELIKSGCTCVVDNHQNWRTHDDCLRAMLDTGIRGVEARGIYDMDRWGFLHRDLIEDTEKAIERNEDLIRRWHRKANDRLHVWIGLQWAPACSDELVERACDLSRKYEVGISMHLHESKHEVDTWRKETGYTPIQYYNTKVRRFLDSHLLAVHCVWLDDRDVRTLAAQGVKVSHNPVSNMYVAAGIAPVPDLMRAGVTVSLGADGAASNNNQDMFEVMKTTALLHKVAARDPLAITAERVLEMATIYGAKALGLEDQIGSIEQGKKADVILVDLKAANVAPLNRVASQLVYCGKSSNVHTVIVDGNIVMQNRMLRSVDEIEAIENAQKASDQLVERNGFADMRSRKWISLPTKEE